MELLLLLSRRGHLRASPHQATLSAFTAFLFSSSVANIQNFHHCRSTSARTGERVCDNNPRNGPIQRQGRGAPKVSRAQHPRWRRETAEKAVLPPESTCESLLGSFSRIVVLCLILTSRGTSYSDHFGSPASPDEMDWSTHYPAFVNEASTDEASQHRRLTKDVEVIDIGCGFGGLLFALSPVMPDKLLLGE